jgi:hypothetical protein
MHNLHQDKILDREEHMNRLIESTEELSVSADQFRRGTRDVKWSMRKRQIILVSIVVAIILVHH